MTTENTNTNRFAVLQAIIAEITKASESLKFTKMENELLQRAMKFLKKITEETISDYSEMSIINKAQQAAEIIDEEIYRQNEAIKNVRLFAETMIALETCPCAFIRFEKAFLTVRDYSIAYRNVEGAKESAKVLFLVGEDIITPFNEEGIMEVVPSLNDEESGIIALVNYCRDRAIAAANRSYDVDLETIALLESVNN